MANIKLNFSSQWPNIQVAKVITSPSTVGEAMSYPYIKKIPHGLGYPPMTIGFRNNQSSTSLGFAMEGIDVDDTYVYIDDLEFTSTPILSYIVIYALDISKEYSYEEYTSEVGSVLEDTSGGELDLRKFLLHSRVVSPMVLSVKTKDYTTSDLSFTYTHPLDYPIFNFGWVRWNPNGTNQPGIWQNAPLAAQGFPWLNTDGFTSSLGSITIGGQPGADKGSIITLRNPAIITESSASVNI